MLKLSGKKAVDEKQFAEYAGIGGLAVNEHGVFFVRRTANVKSNKYEYALCRLNEDGQARELCALDSPAFYATQEGLVFTDKRSKKETEQKLKTTRLKLLRYDARIPAELCELPYETTGFAFISTQAFYFTAAVNRQYTRALSECKGNRPRAEKLLAQNDGCTVFTELPFWYNGEGYTSERRNSLFFRNCGTIIPLSAENESVGNVALSEDKGWLVYTSRKYDSVEPEWEQLVLLDTSTNDIRDISPLSKGRYDAVCFSAAGTLAALVVDMGDPYNIASPAVYVYDIERGQWECLENSGEHCRENSLNSDLAFYASTACQIACDGASVYTLDTQSEQSCIASVSVSGKKTARLGPERALVSELTLGAGALFCTAFVGQEGAEIFRVQTDGAVKQISRINSHISERYTLQKPLPVSFTNENGDEIRGFVLPAVKPSATKRTVLSIHGGPRTAFGETLMHEMQFLAARGYTVIFCNPTGSDGRGDRFANIRGKYGTVDYRDIMAFCHAAEAAYGCVSLANAAVIGGSYGGYMVNHIIGSTDMFKAAVSQRSISNWMSYQCTGDIGHTFGRVETGAELWDNPEALWAQSPLKNADKAKTPTLFIHSDMDYRCPLSQGISMYSALMQHGVPARLCLFHGENHNLSRTGSPKLRIRRLTEMADWLDKYLD